MTCTKYVGYLRHVLYDLETFTLTSFLMNIPVNVCGAFLDNVLLSYQDRNVHPERPIRTQGIVVVIVGGQTATREGSYGALKV